MEGLRVWMAVTVSVVLLLTTTCNGLSPLEQEERDAEIVGHSGTPFNILELFKTPSNLANLISNANKREEEEEEEEEEEMFNNTTSPSLNSTLPSSSSSSSSSSPIASFLTTVLSSSSSSASPVYDDVKFSPASSSQFGDPGSGSKLVDLFSDMTQYTVAATEVAPYASAGAVALLALGALFAIPIAPAILRRTGEAGWSGLPSLREMFGWFRSEDPVAQAWANNYDKGFEHEGQYANGYMRRQHYKNDHTSSGSHQENYYDTPHPYPHPAAHPHPHPYQGDRGSRYPSKTPPKRRQGNRRVSENGYEYVNLEEINRIGDASVRLFAQIVQDMDRERDPYHYEDNELRRRLSTQYDPQNYEEPHYHHEYSYPAQYQENYYPNDKEEYSIEEIHYTHSTDDDQGTEKHAEDNVPHPYRKEGSEGYMSELKGISEQSASFSNNQPVVVSEFPYEFHKSD